MVFNVLKMPFSTISYYIFSKQYIMYKNVQTKHEEENQQILKRKRGFFVVVFCIIDKKERKRIQVFAQIPVD